VSASVAKLRAALPDGARPWFAVNEARIDAIVRAASPVRTKAGAFQQACRRCSGAGRLPYSYMSGVCFACSGSGVEEVKTDPTLLAARRAMAAAKRATERAEAEAARQRAAVGKPTREERYANDPRLGPQTRARIAQFPAVAYEAYSHLEKIDGGANMPWILREYAR
jgi:hypothetical protein